MKLAEKMLLFLCCLCFLNGLVVLMLDRDRLKDGLRLGLLLVCFYGLSSCFSEV
jgi:hypothetical protein